MGNGVSSVFAVVRWLIPDFCKIQQKSSLRYLVPRKKLTTSDTEFSVCSGTVRECKNYKTKILLVSFMLIDYNN